MPWSWAAAALLALQPTVAQAPPLAFYGFRAGVPLRDTDGQVQLLLGPGLTCQQAQADHRLQDCRAVITDPTTGKPLSVWLAAIDSAVGVLTVSGILTSTELAAWRIELESTFGARPTTMQGIPAHAAVGTRIANAATDVARVGEPGRGVGERGGRAGPRRLDPR